MTADLAKSTVDHHGRSETGRDLVTESQTKKIAEDQSARTLHQMNLSFEPSWGLTMDLRVGQLENRVQEEFATEGRLRKQKYENLEK